MQLRDQSIKSRNKKKAALISVILVLIILSSVGAYFYITNQSDTSEVTLSAHQAAESDKRHADNLARDPGNKEGATNTDTPEPPRVDEQTSKASAQISASARVSGDTVYIRGGINNAVVSDGNCYAQLSGPNGESIRKDTTLLQNPSTTDCKTIAIETSSLTKGSWAVKLHYSSNSMEGASNEASFEVN